MTDYQQNFVERLERAAEAQQEQAKADHPAFKADRVKRIKAIELMAAQFRAGDYDAELMARVALMLDDEDMRADASSAADKAITLSGDRNAFWLEKADDLLGEIVDEMRTLWGPDAETKSAEAASTVPAE